MGLDQYAFRLQAKPDKPVDFKLDKTLIDGRDSDQLHYWRKHPDLQGWMENLYRNKGGKADEFNCSPVLLEAEDLDRLEEAVCQGTLPTTEGFFFGRSQPEDREATLEFIAKARAVMKEGSYVAYDSWW
jgi:hypothetical protein